MMDQLDAYFRERANRAFGDIDAVSGRTLQRFSFGLMTAAQNLLSKALRHWRTDRPRAMRLVDRAIALPFDDHEQHVPVLAAAGMILFDYLIDEVEAGDDDTWLEAAVAVLEETEGPARFVLAETLRDIENDWELPAGHARIIRAAVAPIPPQPPLRDRWDLSPEETRELVAGVLEICIAFEDALWELMGTEAD